MVLATALGVRFSDGVVLAADRRVSYGSFILSKSAKKVLKLNNFTGLAMAGLPGDFQELSEVILYNISLYEMEIEKTVGPTSVAKLASVVLYQSRFTRPVYAEILVGGVDPDGSPKLIVLDPAGGLLEENYAAVGTGAQLATGILERSYHAKLTEDEALILAEKAMRGAVERDSLSGDGVDLLIISKGGTREKFIPLRVG